MPSGRRRNNQKGRGEERISSNGHMTKQGQKPIREVPKVSRREETAGWKETSQYWFPGAKATSNDGAKGGGIGPAQSSRAGSRGLTSLQKLKLLPNLRGRLSTLPKGQT